MVTPMKLLDVKPNTDEWLAEREKRFCASDAPAMMGVSKHKSRTRLLDEKKGAAPEEISNFKQKLFDRGHADEDKARVLVELELMIDIPPAVGVKKVRGIKTELLASLDGYSPEIDFSWECKSSNKTLIENIQNCVLEPHYYWQLEHQCLVSGLKKVKFTCSDGTADGSYHMEYESDPERQKELIAAWKQFEKDLDEHEIQAKSEAVEVETPDMPALTCEVDGAMVVSNLAEIIPIARELAKVEMDKPLVTDLDFGQKDELIKKVVKARKAVKEKVEQVRNGFESFSAFADMAAEFDSILQKLQSASEKAVKTEKEKRKKQIADTAQEEVNAAVLSLNKALEPVLLGEIVDTQPDFAAAMKGKSKLDSMQESVDAVKAHCLAQVHAKAEAIEPNVMAYKNLPEAHQKLVHASELAGLVDQSPEAFTAVMDKRIAEFEKTVSEAKQADPAPVQTTVAAPVAQQSITPAQPSNPTESMPVHAAVSNAVPDAQAENRPTLYSANVNGNGQLMIVFSDQRDFHVTFSQDDGPITVAEKLSQLVHHIASQYSKG